MSTSNSMDKTKESVSNARTRICCEWIAKNDRLPKNTAEDKTERHLGSWLNNKKTAYRKRAIHITWFDSDKTVAANMGYPTLFERIRFRKPDQHLAMLDNAIAFVKKRLKAPSPTSSDATEKKLGIWLASRKCHIKKYGTDGVGDELNRLKSAGLPDLYEFTRTNQRLNDMITLSTWLKSHSRYPNPIEPSEESLYKILISLDRRSKLTPAELDILKNDKTEWIFTKPRKPKNEHMSNAIAHQIGEFYLADHQLPTISTNQTLANWIARKKMATRNIKGAGTVYESDRQILATYGIGDIIPMPSLP
jgi:hypothetical protein